MKLVCRECGYVYNGDTVPSLCPVCKSTNTFSDEDMDILRDLCCSQQLIDAMKKLRETDIIDYELKMSQFRTQYEQQKATRQIQKQQSNTRPKCPTCGSMNIEKISVGKKISGSFLFGIFSSDIRNTMHCKDCGAKW